MKMSDIWGLDSIPQSYGHYESFTLNGVERKGDFYGLLFCTEEAANAVSHAINNHDRMADEIAELRESEVKLVNETEDLKCEVEGLLELIRKNSQVFKFLSGKDNETLGAVTEKLQAFDAHLVNEALLDKYK